MSDQPETLAAILAEMRDPCAPRAPSLPALADRIETAVQRFVADDCAKCAHYNAATISLKDALDLANTIANHGTNANGLGDKASATIYALCHEVRTVRGEDANIKQEVQKLRRELRDLRRAPGNASALREALEKIRHEYGWGRIGCRTCVSSEADVERVSDLFEKQIDAALAAPARNCDRPFRSANEAIGAYVGERGDGPHLGYCDAIKWMLAPAEGGDHA